MGWIERTKHWLKDSLFSQEKTKDLSTTETSADPTQMASTDRQTKLSREILILMKKPGEFYQLRVQQRLYAKMTEKNENNATNENEASATEERSRPKKR